MLMTSCSFCWADDEVVVVAEIDWTQQTNYYDDVWYDREHASLAVSSNGLEITSNPPEDASHHWDSQVPIIALIPYVKEGGNYKVKFTLDAPTTGIIRFDFCSWDGSGATMAQTVNVQEGQHEYTLDFNNYPTSCIDAMIFYQCGLMPGKHIIKEVKIWGPEDKREAYAALSNDGKTLTFYNDENMGSRGGTVYKLNSTNNEKPGWYKDFDWGANNPNDKIETMEFDKSFSTARPTTLYYWFTNQKSLSKIKGISNLNTSMVNNMSNLFSKCEKLTALDLSHFDTSLVTDMGAMFEECSNLTCVDLSSFTTTRVERMYSMFYNCKSLKTLDLTSFNTGMLKAMGYMFYGCEKLETLYVSDAWDLTNVEEDKSIYMFSNCGLLKGEKGTTYDGGYLDKTYACIDGGPDSDHPGYLSSVSALYDLYVAGTKVMYDNKDYILGNSIFSYEPSTKTLFVKGDYQNTGYSSSIYSNIEGLTINVTQDSELSGSSCSSLVRLYGNTTFTGDGKLMVKATGDQQNGISVGNKAHITIEKMDMDIQAFGGIICTSYDGTLTIDSSNLTITCSSSSQFNSPVAVYGFEGGGIKLNNCSISSPEGVFVNWGEIDKSGYTPAPCVTITAEGGITTGAELQDKVQSSNLKVQSESWFTIDGQKLSGKPVQKGIYIQNGKKVVIK